MASLSSDPAVLASKRVVYLGGLPSKASVQLVRAAMIPFGEVKSVDIPMDFAENKHRGFAFVEFEDPDDAEEAIFNMNGAELLGKAIRVSMAQANQVNKLSSSEPVWKSDEWFQQNVSGQDEEALNAQKTRSEDAKILQDL